MTPDEAEAWAMAQPTGTVWRVAEAGDTAWRLWELECKGNAKQLTAAASVACEVEMIACMFPQTVDEALGRNAPAA